MSMVGEFTVVLLLLIIIVVLCTKTTKVNASFGRLFDPKVEATTILPVSLHAASCDHDWSVVTEQIIEMPHEKKCVIILNCTRCGTLDKTIQITSPMPAMPPEPCRHDWDKVIDQKMENEVEQKLVVVMTCRQCGVVEKVIQQLAASKPKSECRHQWQTEKKIELDSAYEQMVQGITVKDQYNKKTKTDKIELDLDKAPSWMFKKSYVSIRICSECGEIDKTLASNFELSEDEEPEETLKIKRKA